MSRGIAVVLAGVALACAALPAGAGGATTTERRTVTGDRGGDFSMLRYGPGWKRVVRTEVGGTPGRRRARTRRSLLYFAQMSDFQLADEESPSRVEFVDVVGSPFEAAWRPQEAFVPQIVDRMVRAINAFTRSPIASGRRRTRGRMRLAITTGDSADSQQRNEVAWVVRLLEGGQLDPNSGREDGACALPIPDGEAARYTGVQDFDDYPERHFFYDPDKPSGAYASWPRWPGLMDRAQAPFPTPGLRVPSYVTFGNHDGLVQGNAFANAAYEAIATGCLKPMTEVPLGDLGSILQTAPDRLVAVPPDPDRAYVDHAGYRELHATGAQRDAHGFAHVTPGELDASAGHASYYAFSPRRGIRMIAIDTVSEAGVAGPSANGNLDAAQFAWLERRIRAAERKGQLVIVFGHHPIRSLNADLPDEIAGPCLVEDSHGHGLDPGCDRDPRSSGPVLLGDDLRELLLAHPNVIAYVAGHTHSHRVTPFARTDGSGGFWGIETASEVDWPIQARLLELMDNRDGTLSIFGTIIDPLGTITAPPAGTDAAAMGPADLAAIGRTLSFNDPQTAAPGSEGEPTDRNVELLLPDPRR